MNSETLTRRHTSQAGFSLIEAMVSMTILAIATLALTSGIINSKGLQMHAVKINEASKAGNSIMESFRRMGYLALEEAVPSGSYSAADLSTVYAQDGTAYSVLDSVTLYNVQQTLTEYNLTETITVEQGLEGLRVTVEIYPSHDDQNPVASMASFISKNGINFR